MRVHEKLMESRKWRQVSYQYLKYHFENLIHRRAPSICCRVPPKNTFRLNLRGSELNFTKFLNLESKENILSQMKVSKNLEDQLLEVQHKKSINFNANKSI